MVKENSGMRRFGCREDGRSGSISNSENQFGALWQPAIGRPGLATQGSGLITGQAECTRPFDLEPQFRGVLSRNWNLSTAFITAIFKITEFFCMLSNSLVCSSEHLCCVWPPASACSSVIRDMPQPFRALRRQTGNNHGIRRFHRDPRPSALRGAHA